MTELREPPDTAARRMIREDLDATLVVEAAAGTGKTTELVARVIAVLRSGRTTLERIVAVTFTERAAGELKLRLRMELERARDRAIHDGHADACARFEVALAELELARVGTIHSFCTDVLKERPIEARIDPLFGVAAEDDAERIFAIAFDAWFQAALADPREGTRRILRRANPTDLLRDAGRTLVDHRDFPGAWRRDPFDR
ncbi:MAG: UvrD-helicase domain-containing protein, partial [Proteobacteria bacterium]|nr:UvrD-helicase domain-containing protein [Pseudomonadota bacterium]